MNTECGQPGTWSNRRWWAFIALVFVCQLGFIFVLSDRTPPPVRKVRPSPDVRVASQAASLALEASSPTLFALPTRRGFSAGVWLNPYKLEFGSFDWSEPTNWLALLPARLGSMFNLLVETNATQPRLLLAMPLPTPVLPKVEDRTTLADRSRFRWEKDPKGWRLAKSPELPSWQHGEILSNSVVQTVIDEEGRPSSVALLSSSGLRAADQYALELARAARYEASNGVQPALNEKRDPLRSLTWGRMVFEWHTIPTNAPAAKP